MKFKTTQKAIKANYQTIICVPYCDLQNLLYYESPIAFTVRREGWAADIYDVGGRAAIVTGYAPFGNVRPGHETLQEYEKQAQQIRDKRENTQEQLAELLNKFINAVAQ